MDSPALPHPGMDHTGLSLSVGGVLLLIGMVGLDLTLGLPALSYLPAALMYSGLCILVTTGFASSCKPPEKFGWANRVTLFRAVLVILIAAITPFPAFQHDLAWPLAFTALAVLLLDGVDGRIARTTGTQSEFGARFDMELDGFFILVLCVCVLAFNKAGPWVLALGAMRYLFIVAGRFVPQLNSPLPESFRRKTVCVWQVVTLMVAITPLAAPWFTQPTLALSLALLVYSFSVDTFWLLRHGGQNSG